MTTVLIVDDHPSLRLVLKMHLSQVLGVTGILEADNGQATIQIVKDSAPGLVILDIDIPKINGLDVIPRIRAIQPSIRILVVSGQDQSVFAPRVKTAGANGYVSKAQEISEIIRCVEAILAGYTVFPNTEGPQAPRLERVTQNVDRLNRLSDKEIVIMQMLARGMSNKEIGEALFISNKTVSTHKTRIMGKLEVQTLVELVDFARQCHIAP
ncbi:response regulator transcription factor [Achromobacter deleyi]|uniref:response regulator transcription factor n=1 Tax=Achromobacter deleyi TaxID=1353891 RepID=UPI00149327C6|nr:response regulator transcription factor [Achromobacter deleyi]QVQ26828.1 response regulator transcription factor [Achromobacter deleyi]UIP22404.1 response regulator transcription factor [Achromobacter deleyi]